MYVGNYSKWQNFVEKNIFWWKKFILSPLMHNMGYPVLVVHYEDIVTDNKTEVSCN